MECSQKIIAIMGPSGAGKTTLGSNLHSRNNIVIPKHTTTRNKRDDDIDGFYRYLTHEEYQKNFSAGCFLISSGDGPIISKEYGNFYGVFLDDCLTSWKKSNTILLFTSYKDILSLASLRNLYEVMILNLTFMNIAEGVKKRIENDKNRNHLLKDIESRIFWALKDDKDYRELVNLYSNGTIYTDVCNIEETYSEACKILKLERR